MELRGLTIHALREMLVRREVSSVEVVQAFFRRIEKIDPQIHAYLVVARKEALEQARRADEAIESGGDLPALCGVPLAIKDILCTRGIRTTCGSAILADYIPPYDATVVQRLKAQGAVILGKVNMDEFAMGSSTENSCFGPTRNPWSLERVPGGSSGGCAAAVAADTCAGAIGSDTGGSIREPASFCGVVGLKPTYGRVSRYGLVAFASSLDQVGPMTKDVEDAAILLKAICGFDPRDSTSAKVEVPDFRRSLVRDVKGLRLGIPKEYFIEGMDPDVERVLDKTIGLFEELGARCTTISLPHTAYAQAAYYIISTAEASSNLARYDGVKYGHRCQGYGGIIDMYEKTRTEGFGAEVKRRIMLGTYALSAGYYDAYYRKATQVRRLVKQDFDDAFEVVDVILAPTCPTPAFPIGEKTEDPLQMYLMDVFTIPVNMAGIPGISIPCGFSRDRLPIGLQLLGRSFDEKTLLQTAYTFEQETGVYLERPPID
ncbi:MAG: Asp-tRNA(Asn)/Glu-tRNA(Gln) amidotransferase subunit GatA [Deltaproteobacteria bacterium]|nr:Asp-tRNA(Asn)/Glu-tRNA(Gln) amidotransferase subunit GatA [Deltaproteobacteria bacterium]MBW2121463.1 Asp-tRNA(Asn)/Glu-tRNA(Gln) amidotransferase subunit GatA [Deltaproteobacteria bacterium]